MTNPWRRRFLIIGSMMVVIGCLLLIFGFISQEWISEERSRGTSTGNYQFWDTMETTRQYFIPVSIGFIIVGGVLIISPLVIPTDRMKKSDLMVPWNTEKKKFVGTWREGDSIFIFFSDGTGSIPEAVSATWDIKDGKLVITTLNQLSTYTYSYSFSNNDNDLALSSTYETLHLTRQ